MRLKLLAPFRSHLRLSLGCTLKTGRLSAFKKDYLKFWNALQKVEAAQASTGSANIRFLHSESNLGPDTVRYTTIDADTLRYTAELIEIKPTRSGEITDLDALALRSTVDELGKRRLAGKEAWDKYATRASLLADSTIIHVFDNNISIFETELDVSDALAGLKPEDVDTTLDDLREFAVFCGEVLIKDYYSSLVFPLLRSIAEQHDAQHVFVDPLYTESSSIRDVQGLGEFEYPIYRDGADEAASTEVLWVTRSLVFDLDDGAQQSSREPLPLPSITRTWLRAVGDTERTNKVAKDDDAYSTRWLNYLFREKFVAKNEGRDFNDIWDAMQLCQYYYSAVESLNDRLNRVLSFANQDSAENSVRDLHQYLEDIVRRCELVLASYNEMQKYLKRDKFQAFKDILDYWNFGDMEKQVREKMSVCRSRLESLSHQSSEKGRLYTEVLLVLLSLLTVLDMSLTLALFGRSPTDTVYAQDANYSGPILAWFASKQPHVIIIVAAILVALLGLRFYFFRRKRLLFK